MSVSTKVNPGDIIDVRIADEPMSQQVDPTPRDSVDVDNSLTPFEKMVQKMYDNLREAFNLDPTGEFRAVAVMVSTDKGKIWKIVADSTQDQVYVQQDEVWSKAYVESEVAKTKTAYAKTQKASPV